jgi:hypothetical protein
MVIEEDRVECGPLGWSAQMAVLRGHKSGRFLAIGKIVASLLLLALTPNLVQAAGQASVNEGYGTSANISAPAINNLSTNLTTNSRSSGFKYKVGTDFSSFGSETEQAQTAGFGVTGQFEHQLVDDLKIRVRAEGKFESGHAQSRFGDNTPQTGIFLQEAVLAYKPFSFLALDGGAIDQSYLKSALLIDKHTFPGAMEKVLIGDRKLGAEFQFEQAIPTSTTLTTETEGQEETPTFMAQTLTLQAEPTRSWFMQVYGTHYQFNNLPSKVANDSELYGNTMGVDVGLNASSFLFQFDGWLAGAETSVRILPSWKIGMGAQYLQNMKAPTGFNAGSMAFLDSTVSITPFVDIVPRGEIFFLESDVVPGAYNSSDFGHNNRDGYAADLDFVFKKSKFKIGARYVNANLINPNDSQSAQQTILLKLETLYEML